MDDQRSSGDSGASEIYQSHENIRSIFSYGSDNLSSSTGSADQSPIDIGKIQDVHRQDSIIESFDKLSVLDDDELKSLSSGSGFVHRLCDTLSFDFSDFKNLVDRAKRLCVRTPAYEQAALLLEKHRNVTLCGSLKDGKTTFALNLCSDFLQLGYNIYYHDFSNKYSSYLPGSDGEKSLYVFENIFSSTKVQKELEKMMFKKKEKPCSFFLFTCRSFDFKGNTTELDSEMLSGETVVCLSDEIQHCSYIRWKILSRYTSLSTELITRISMQTPSHTGFPGLCKLFAEDIVEDPLWYFRYPHKHYQLLLTSLIRNRRTACVFLMLLLMGGRCYVKDLIEMKHIFLDVQSKLQEIFPKMRLGNILDEVASFYRTFLKESNHIVTFANQVVYDAAVFVVDSLYPGFLWRHCQIEFVENENDSFRSSDNRIVYMTTFNSKHVINYLVKNLKQRPLRDLFVHPIFNNERNTKLFFHELEEVNGEGNMFDYDEGNGSTILFWCMKSSNSHLKKHILQHKFLKNENIVKCLAFCLKEGENELFQIIITKLIARLEGDTDFPSQVQYLLLLTATHGDVDACKFLIEHGADINATDINGQTCLHVACSHGQLSVVNYLIDNFETFEIKDKHGMTPAMIAMARRFPDLVQVFRAKGIDPATKNEEGNNLVHLACLSGDLATIRFLLHTKQQDVNIKGNNGRTPVMMAALTGESEVFTALVEFGCDLTITDDKYENVLHIASQTGCQKVVEQILSTGKININSVNKTGRNALMLASLNGHKDVFDLLLENGCNANATDQKGNTALHIACLGTNGEFVKYLFAKGIFDFNLKGEGDRTPVMMVTQSGMGEVFDFMMPTKPDLHSLDSDGNNVLHIACLFQRINIAMKLVSLKDLDINSRGKNAMTPILCAAFSGNVRLFEFLVAAGADVSLRDGDGNTVFHIAAREGNVDMVTYLMKQELFDIDDTGFQSRSPLMMATHKGHKEIVDILLSAGSDVTRVDENGESTLLLACSSEADDDEIVDMLMKRESSHTDKIGRDGWTPIMYAAKVNNLNVVKKIIKAFDVYSINNAGDNALHVACLSRSCDVAEYLMHRFPGLTNTTDIHGKTPFMLTF